jgi:hypothetical protein
MPNQKTRALIFLLYIFVLFIANYIAFGNILPSSGGEGLWFYTGFASILLGSLLVTPFFTKPVDAISYSAVAIIALLLLNSWESWSAIDRFTFMGAFIYSFFVLIIAFLAIIAKDSTKQNLKKFSNTCKVLSDVVGNHAAIFSVIIFFAIIVFHRSSPREVFTIMLTWALIVVIKPENRIFKLVEYLKKIWSTKVLSVAIGEIAGFQSPGLVLVRQKDPKRIRFGTPLIFKDEHAPLKAGIGLDYTGRDEGLLLRTIEFDVPIEVEDEFLKMASVLPLNSVSKFDVNAQNNHILESVDMFKKIKYFVGVVSHETSVDSLYFEVIQERDLEEGRLVEVSIRGKAVLYQVIDGMTKEDVIYKKNTFGYVRAKAKKIGLWDTTRKKFIPVKWLPNANAPVYIKTTDEFTPTKEAVGHFPGTNYTVGLKSVSHLVTHNTAILGILGVGKSMLAIELVERMIADNIKIVCIDLTKQYALELSKFFNEQEDAEALRKLQAIGAAGKTKCERNVEEGGSIKSFTDAISIDLKTFIDTDDKFIKIYNPSHFEVWYQDSKPFQGIASMATLSPTGITQIISDAVLKIMQEKGMTDNARVCLVYEEAHSLIPEWNSTAAEGDRAASNGTARAILQGRKYGLGCLLVTQRTANVTKTILNQCNTIFAMRTFDDTGKGFLANYIGSEHADILPTLQERYAVFFGKASLCENPVLLRLNDRPDFVRIFREQENE